VIVARGTFVASASAPALMSARPPVLSDVRARWTSTSEPADAAARITPRTRAIVAVHFCAIPRRTSRCASCATANDLILIEDCAQAMRRAPSTTTSARSHDPRELGAFSFFSKKPALRR